MTKRLTAKLFFTLLLLSSAPFVLAQNDGHRFEVSGLYTHARMTYASTTFTFNDGSRTVTVNACQQPNQYVAPNASKALCDRRGFNGFDVSAVGNITRYWGIKGNFSGYFKKDRFTDTLTNPTETFTSDYRERYYQFLGGVQLKDNATEARVKPYAHALFGGARYRSTLVMVSTNPVNSDNQVTEMMAPALKLGGGLDVRLNARMDLRVFEINYNPVFGRDHTTTSLITPFSNQGVTKHNISFGIGLVIH